MYSEYYSHSRKREVGGFSNCTVSSFDAHRMGSSGLNYDC